MDESYSNERWLSQGDRIAEKLIPRGVSIGIVFAAHDIKDVTSIDGLLSFDNPT